jgi:hypothetical protein
MAVLAASTGTLHRLAMPGIDPHTLPYLSAIASIPIHTMRVSDGSNHTVDSVIEEKSFVKVTLIALSAYSSWSSLSTGLSTLVCQRDVVKLEIKAMQC